MSDTPDEAAVRAVLERFDVPVSKVNPRFGGNFHYGPTRYEKEMAAALVAAETEITRIAVLDAESCAALEAAEARVRALEADKEEILNDWMRQYAPEQCDASDVAESGGRVLSAGGTLAYIASRRGDRP